MGEEALGSSTLGLRFEFRVPPAVVNVDCDAKFAGPVGIDGIANIQSLTKRVHACAVGCVHRVQRFDCEPHLCGDGVRQQRALDEVADADEPEHIGAAPQFRGSVIMMLSSVGRANDALRAESYLLALRAIAGLVSDQ